MAPASKCLAARSPSRTVPETAHTTTILIRFPVAIDIVDAPSTDQRLGFDFLRFGFVDVVFADIAFPGYGGSGLFWRPDPDAFPVEVCPRSVSHHRMLPGAKA